MKKIGKINWMQTIFVMIFTGIIIGMISQSNLMAFMISFFNLIGGIGYGMLFGSRK